MNRELWLLRHGKSEQNDSIDDYDRALKKRGKQNAKQLGEWLHKQELIPDIIISSPAKRAIETAKKVQNELGVADLVLKEDKRLYFEGLEQIKAVLAECPVKVKKLMIVGHNPDLEYLVAYLIGNANVPDVDKLLPTAALARLKMPDDWTRLTEGCAELLSITLARSLSE